jgi:hypothetical protein
MDGSSYVRFLVSPGWYYVRLACHLDDAWQFSLREEGFSVEWPSADRERNLSVSEEADTILLVHAQDQGELLAVLTYLHNLAIPLLTVEYAGAADDVNVDSSS